MRHVPLSVCFVISNYYFYVDHWLFAFFFLTELVVCFVIPVVGIWSSLLYYTKTRFNDILRNEAVCQRDERKVHIYVACLLGCLVFLQGAIED